MRLRTLSPRAGGSPAVLIAALLLAAAWPAAAIPLADVDEPLDVPADPYAGTVTARLLADVEALAPGQPFTVAVEIDMAEGWHTYWENGGDAGLATDVAWTLPAGFEAGPLQFPVPHRYEEEGDLVTFGYADRVRLLTEIRPPADLPAGERVEIRGAVSWLQCKDLCIPGAADVSVRLPVEAAPRPAAAPVLAAFADARAGMPRPASSLERVALHTFQSGTPLPAGGEGQVAVVFEGLEGFDAGASEFFPRPSETLWLRDASFRSDGRHLALVIPVNVDAAAETDGTRLLGAVLRIARSGGGDPWLLALDVPVTLAPAGAYARPTPAPVFAGAGPFLGEDRLASAGGTAGGATPPAALPLGTLLRYLLFAFVGGMILNVMPCVLPVVSLKVLSFVSKAQEDHAKIARLGFVFAAGVLVSFLVLAAAVIALQAAGEHIGWGFQFQNPVFVAGLALVVFLFSMSLLGALDASYLDALVMSAVARVSGPGLAAAEHRDYADAFFHGVLTTVLATPCTAPMLGTAVAFAFSQPAHVILLIFLTVGAGLALPYLLLSLHPGWLRFVPKPGMWMDRFKQVMGFLLLATLVWLLSVFGAQVGVNGLVKLLAFLLVIGLFCWMHSSFLNLSSGAGRVVVLWALTLAGTGVAYAKLLHDPLFKDSAVAAAPGGPAVSGITEGGVTWEPYSPEVLQTAVASGRTVFLDLTAEWCWTCKVNEKTVLADDEVEELFLANDVLTLKGDWTRKDPRITEILRRHNRAGVPFYAVYPPGNGEPIVLPEIINKAMVLESLRKAGPSTAGARAS